MRCVDLAISWITIISRPGPVQRHRAPRPRTPTRPSSPISGFVQRKRRVRVVLRGDGRDFVAGELAHHLAGREVLFREIGSASSIVRQLPFRRRSEARRETSRRTARVSQGLPLESDRARSRSSAGAPPARPSVRSGNTTYAGTCSALEIVRRRSRKRANSASSAPLKTGVSSARRRRATEPPFTEPSLPMPSLHRRCAASLDVDPCRALSHPLHDVAPRRRRNSEAQIRGDSLLCRRTAA